MVGVVFTAGSSTVVFLNYNNQTTFVPALARSHPPESAFLIPALSMANPGSLAWALEMWGYGFLGVATLAASRIFTRNATEIITSKLMAANGVVSILGALLTVWDMHWLFSPAGFAGYVAWNFLFLAMVFFMAKSFNQGR